jgi:hypothetical protein
LTGRIDRFLASADKKLASAHKILAFDEEACLQQAYEAMLKASLGFMFSHGFRARSQPGHHIAIIDFVRSRIDKKHAGLLTVTASLAGMLKTGFVAPISEALWVLMGLIFCVACALDWSSLSGNFANGKYPARRVDNQCWRRSI